MSDDDLSFPELSDTWQRRFDFYSRFGSPASSPEATAVYRQLPFGERRRLYFNVPAFFFGVFYFAVKGMWRKGLPIAAVGIGLVIVGGVLGLPNGVNYALTMACAAIYATTANWSYYLHVTQSSRSWNPFEGISFRSPDAG